MPAGSPWQKADRRVSSAHHRWNMTRLATDQVSYFTADDREVHRQGWTFTIDTLATFDRTEEIVLILGADAAQGLPTWQSSDEVVARVELAVVPRPGVDAAGLAKIPGKPKWLDMPALPISGTEIRARTAAGLGARFLVSEDVYDYIELHRLYRTPDYESETRQV